MKIFHKVYILLLSLLLTVVCGELCLAGEPGPILISGRGNNAHSPYFTTDNKGNPVLSWLENAYGSNNMDLFFAISYDNGRSFSKPVKVPAASGASAAGGECPPKLVWKKDGTVVAVFRRSAPTERNPYAGDIYTLSSKDNGRTWSAAQSIVETIDENASRGYYDVKVLPNGELGLIWLEGRREGVPSGRGSSIHYTSSRKEGGWHKAVTISANACQCCKTKLLVDSHKNVHILYREIYEDGSRDIAHSVSKDEGKTFSPAVNISRDRWEISGCPHVGPDATERDGTVTFAWYTMGGNPGIYINTLSNNRYTEREVVVPSVRASRPQLASIKGSSDVMVWEELLLVDGKYIQYVGIGFMDGKEDEEKANWYIKGMEGAHHPVIIPLEDKFAGIAFTLSGDRTDAVYFFRLNTEVQDGLVKIEPVQATEGTSEKSLFRQHQ